MTQRRLRSPGRRLPRRCICCWKLKFLSSTAMRMRRILRIELLSNWRTRGYQPRLVFARTNAAGSRVSIAVAGLLLTGVLLAQTPADVVLLNGKVVTVDDRFSIAQAVAIRGDRFV